MLVAAGAQRIDHGRIVDYRPLDNNAAAQIRQRNTPELHLLDGFSMLLVINSYSRSKTASRAGGRSSLLTPSATG